MKEPHIIADGSNIWSEKDTESPLIALRGSMALTPAKTQGWPLLTDRNRFERLYGRPVLRFDPDHLRLITDQFFDSTLSAETCEPLTIPGVGDVLIAGLFRVKDQSVLLFNAKAPGLTSKRLVGTIAMQGKVKTFGDVAKAVMGENYRGQVDWLDHGRAFLWPTIYTTLDLSAMGLVEKEDGVVLGGLYKAGEAMEGPEMTVVRGTFKENASPRERGYPVINLGKEPWYQVDLKPVPWYETIFWS